MYQSSFPCLSPHPCLKPCIAYARQFQSTSVHLWLDCSMCEHEFGCSTWCMHPANFVFLTFAGTIMSYAKNRRRGSNSEDFNHFLIYNQRDVIACHDYKVCLWWISHPYLAWAIEARNNSRKYVREPPSPIRNAWTARIRYMTCVCNKRITKSLIYHAAHHGRLPDVRQWLLRRCLWRIILWLAILAMGYIQRGQPCREHNDLASPCSNLDSFSRPHQNLQGRALAQRGKSVMQFTKHWVSIKLSSHSMIHFKHATTIAFYESC